MSGLREITNTMPEGVVIVDSAGRVLFANPAATRLFGRSDGELVGTVFGYPIMAANRAELTIGAHKIEMQVERTTWQGRSVFVTSLRDDTQRLQAAADIKSLSAALEEANDHLQRLGVKPILS